MISDDQMPWDERMEAHGRRAELALRELIESIDPLVEAERAGLTARAADSPQRALAVCRDLNATMVQLQELAIDAVEAAMRAGVSQKAAAEALGLKPDSLAGAKAQFGGQR